MTREAETGGTGVFARADEYEEANRHLKIQKNNSKIASFSCISNHNAIALRIRAAATGRSAAGVAINAERLASARAFRRTRVLGDRLRPAPAAPPRRPGGCRARALPSQHRSPYAQPGGELGLYRPAALRRAPGQRPGLVERGAVGGAAGLRRRVRLMAGPVARPLPARDAQPRAGDRPQRGLPRPTVP